MDSGKKTAATVLKDYDVKDAPRVVRQLGEGLIEATKDVKRPSFGRNGSRIPKPYHAIPPPFDEL